MRLIFLACIFCLFTSCKETLEPKEEPTDLGFQIPNDVKLELISKEPLVNAPVSIDFDDKGRIWVVEMTSYMPNIEGSEEETKNNRIKILSDVDSDGYFEKSEIFLNKLTLPRSILHAYGGLVYSEPPNLWHVEINNNSPGKKTLIDSTYAIDGNVEHKPSSLTLNMDNWIYSSSSNVRYRKMKGKWIKEFTAPRGQWGMTKDNFGRLIYNNNSTLIAADEVIPNALFSNKYMKLGKNNNQIITEDQKVYPIQATSVNRGYQDGVLDADGLLTHTTSACSPLFFRDKNFEAWSNAAFICLPEINAIKKLNIKDDKFTKSAKATSTDAEYLITLDEGFRPVDLKVGPDGNIYIVDMHRGIIQHKAYMTSYLREELLGKKLDTIYEMGRILRLSPKDSTTTNLSFDISTDPISFLFGENAFLRDKAQHYIVSENKKEFAQALKEKIKTETSEIKLLHSIWTLEGLDLLSESDLIPLLEKDMPHVAYHSFHLLTQMTVQNKEYLSLIVKNLLKKDRPDLDLLIAHHASSLNLFDKEELLDFYLTILKRTKSAPKLIEGIVADNLEHQSFFLENVNEAKDSSIILFKEELQKAEERRKNNKPVYYYNKNLDLVDRRTVGMKLYRTFCGPCHGIDGEGIERLAPSLINSDYVSGEEDKLILITLHGLSGPIKMNGVLHHYTGEMAGLNENDELNDKDIKDILHFVRNAFTSAPYSIDESRITELRNVKPAKGGSFTEASLDSTLQVLKQN